MKNSFLFILVFSICFNAIAQIEINGATGLVCPGEQTIYTVSPASLTSCQYKWTVTNGLFSNGLTTIEGFWPAVQNVTVTWDNVQFQGGQSIPQGNIKVEIVPGSCLLPSGEKTSDNKNVVIKTLNNVTPGSISGNISFTNGTPITRIFSIPRIQFPGTGQNGGSISIAYADSYQWLIPAGWQIGSTVSDGTTPITGLGFSVSIQSNSCTGNGEKIKVRGFSSCGPGYVSNWREVTVVRNLPAMSFSQAPPDNIVCAVTAPITVSVNPVAGAQSYTWTKPSGWSGTSTTNSITLTPNGTSAGTVSVRANLCSTQTNPVSKTINLQLFNPQAPPTVNGLLVVCNSATYTLSNPAPMTTATWTISPSSLVTTSSGTGFNALVTKANASSSGTATITFNLTGPCGPLPPFTKQIQIGVVNESQATATASCNFGQLCYVCPGNTYVFTALPPLGHQVGYSYQWTKPSNWSVINQNANTITLYVPENNPEFFPPVRYRVNNGCGWSGYSGLTVAPGPGCGGYYYSYSIYPNPSSQFLTIEPNLKDEFKDMESEVRDLFRSMEAELMPDPFVVKIYNVKEELLFETSSKGDKVTISLEEFKPGNYFVHIENKTEVIRKQIIVEK